MRIEVTGLDGVARRLRSVIDAVSPQGRDELAGKVADALKLTAEEVWPSRRHPENVFARDRSVKRWVVLKGAPGERVLANEAGYSGFVDAGFTRAGRATARPWQARGSTIYRSQIITAGRERIVEIVNAWTRAALGGDRG